MNINTMNRNINNLIQLSWNVNNFFKQSPYVIVQRLIRTTQYELQIKENRRSRRVSIAESKLSLPFNREAFINELKCCRTNNDVFLKIQQRSKDMTAEDAVLVISKLYDLSRNCLVDQDITKLYEFNTLCEILTNDIRTLSTHYIINALRSLLYLKVPSSAVIIQKLLQLLRQSINHLTPDQGVYLMYLLPKFPKSPLAEALIIALPVVIETTVKTKLNTDNMKSIVGVLTFFTEQNTVNGDIVEYILNCLNKCVDESINISIIDASKALFTLLKVDDTLIPKGLLPKIYDALSENIHDYKSSSLLVLIHKISTVRSLRFRNTFYNAKFIDVSLKRILSEKPEIQEIFRLILALNRIFHSNNEIIDYVMDRCIEIQYFSEHNNITERNKLITAIARNGQKPSSWEVMQDSLLIDDYLHEKFSTMLELSIHLLSLNCYWPKLIERVFDSCENIRSESIFSKTMIMVLHHTVKNFYPQYYGPLLTDKDIELIKVSIERRDINQFLKKDLESFFGGWQYVMTNVQTEYGLFVDFGVIMRKGGYPVAQNNQQTLKPPCLENIEVPKDSQVFLFMCLRQREYLYNSHCLTPRLRLFEKLLKTNSTYTVIKIFNEEWLNLSNSARLKYLTDLIQPEINQQIINVTV